MNSSFGRKLKVTVFGGSHEPETGVTVEGLPGGERIDREALSAFLSRRSTARFGFSSERREKDEVEFRSGLHNDVTTGEPLTAAVRNLDVRPEDYEKIRFTPRPGHADLAAVLKYGEIPAGGGAFSGRMTLPLSIAGGIALQILNRKGIRIFASLRSVGEIADPSEFTAPVDGKAFPAVSDEAGAAMQALIEETKAAGDSVGGVIRCRIEGLPAGLGGPLFDGLEGRFSEALLAIPAVKGVEFGSGFAGASRKGSENNDAIVFKRGALRTETNHAGGILGGVSVGMPVEFAVAVKPTPSIALPERTVDLRTLEETEIRITGRHDACIAPRAVPVVEAVAALVILDALLSEDKFEHFFVASGEDDCSAKKRRIRSEIDKIDKNLAALFAARQKLAVRMAELKETYGLPLRDEAREEAVVRQFTDLIPEEDREDGEAFIRKTMELSRKKQEQYRPFRKAGLLGKTLAHSLSPAIHAEIGSYSYELFEKQPEELADFFREAPFDGLNVTIPYKQAVLPYLDELSPAAKAVGAVNTVVKRPDGTLFGDNTDVDGFLALARRSGIAFAGRKTLILGTGGAAKAVAYAVERLGGEAALLSRNGKEHYEIPDSHTDADILVNATPVGMFPENGQAPVSLEELSRVAAVFDLIYNPLRTALLLDANMRGIPAFGGLYMLIAQAGKSAERWTGRQLEDPEAMYRRIRSNVENIVLIGMPGAGKTAIGAELGKALNRPFVDADEVFREKAGMTAEAFLQTHGEDAFRDRETEILRELRVRTGIVLSTGGGCVTREENLPLLKENGRIFWIRRPVDALDREARPLSSGDLQKLFEAREPLYRHFADHELENDGTVRDAAEKILFLRSALQDPDEA